MDLSVPVMSIYVRDLEEALGFYCGTLGFSVKQRYGACIATLDNAGAMIVLEEIEDGKEPRVVPAIAVADVAAECARLAAAGATLLTPEPHPFPAGTMISILDTSGNQLDIVQFGG